MVDWIWHTLEAVPFASALEIRSTTGQVLAAKITAYLDSALLSEQT